MKSLFFLLSTSVVLAQSPVLTRLVSPTPIDSTLRVAPPNQLYDFYYSAEQADAFLQLGSASYTRDDRVKKQRFRDRAFTEQVPKGHKPDARFDDYTLIGSGKLEEVSREGSW